MRFEPWLINIADPWTWPDDTDKGLEGCPDALRQGVTLLAVGSTGQAMNELRRCIDAATARKDGDTAVAALGLHWLAQSRHYNHFPGDNGANSREIESVWTATDELKAIHNQWSMVCEWARAAGRQSWRWLQFAASIYSAQATVTQGRQIGQTALLVPLQIAQLEGMRADIPAASPRAEALVVKAMAQVHARAGQFDDALQHAAEATKLYGYADDDVGIAGALAMQADIAARLPDPATVRGLVISDAAYATSELAWTVEADEMKASSASFENGISLLDEAEARFVKAGCTRGVASVRLRQAHAAQLRGDAAASVERTHEALGALERVGDDMHAQLARGHVALARVESGELFADEELASSIGAWGANGGSFSYALGIGIMFTRAGRQALLQRGDYERAEGCFTLAVALNDALGAHLRVAQSQADVAALHRLISNRDRARTHQENAIDTLTELAKKEGPQAVSARQRAALLVQQLFQDALDHRDAERMERALARVPMLAPPGDVSAYAVTGLMALSNAQGSVLIPLYRGVDARNEARTKEAEKLFDEALTRAKAVEGPEGNFLEAVVHAQRRNFDEAVVAFDRYLTSGGPGGGFSGTLLEAMRQMSLEQYNREHAEMLCRRAEQAFSFMVRAKSFNEAKGYLDELERLGHGEWWRQDSRPWQPLSDIGEMFEGLNDIDAALTHYRLAIDELEKRRAQLSRDELKTALAADFGAEFLYFQAVRVALRKSAHDDAFALSEMARARGLLDLVGSNVARVANESSPLVTEWRELSAQSQLWRGMLANARRTGNDAARQVFESKLANCEAKMRTLVDAQGDEMELVSLLRGEVHTVSLADFADGLDDSTAALMYMALGEELLLWAVTREGMAAHAVIELRASVLARKVDALVDECVHPSAAHRIESMAVELGQILLEPLRGVIAAHEHLSIVPFGALHRLPFGALRYDGEWLAAHHTISILPSASIYAQVADAAMSASPSLLCVGNPAGMKDDPPFGKGPELHPLPWSEDEANYIAKLYGTKALVGKAATERKVVEEAPKHDILHFATHGVLYEEAPLYSGIALADGRVLRVDELMGLQLKAQLVTLSACNSGRGELRRGEEIVGLTRGLLAAGAKSAVVTLWAVEDGSTAVFMKHFYDELKRNGNAAAALQGAQVKMRSYTAAQLDEQRGLIRGIAREQPPEPLPGNHPRHWAAFMYTGARPASSKGANG